MRYDNYQSHHDELKIKGKIPQMNGGFSSMISLIS